MLFVGCNLVVGGSEEDGFEDKDNFEFGILVSSDQTVKETWAILLVYNASSAKSTITANLEKKKWLTREMLWAVVWLPDRRIPTYVTIALSTMAHFRILPRQMPTADPRILCLIIHHPLR